MAEEILPAESFFNRNFGIGSGDLEPEERGYQPRGGAGQKLFSVDRQWCRRAGFGGDKNRLCIHG